MSIIENTCEFIDQIFDALCKNIEGDHFNDLFLKYVANNVEQSKWFSKEVKSIRHSLEKDLDFFFISDPAAHSKEEIILAYPGYLAISYYRVAHILYELEYFLIARIISEKAHKLTGIDINPGAKIASPFFIDHGTGIVIGETTIIGKNVKMYQGVTLGALSLSRGNALQGNKRHPTIGNNVTIYAGVSILGNIVIGDNVTIGSNAFITEDIPSDMTITIAKPKHIVKKKKTKQK